MVVSYTYFSFQFFFLNALGKPTHRRRYTGVVNNDGIRIRGAMLSYEDIMDIRWENDHQMVILLYPYIAVSRLVTENILPDTYTLILDTKDSELGNLKSTLNKYFTYAHTERKRRELDRVGQLDTFHSINCPRCESTIDLSGLNKTKYIYCRYCETIFSNMGNTIPHMEAYRPCPECRYFGHVQEFRDVRFYFYGKKKGNASYFRTITCCDTCAERRYQEAVWRNLGFLIAFPFSMYLRFQITMGQHPDFERLGKANRLAQDGDLEGAVREYDFMLMQHKYHPGLIYNKARAYLMKSNLMPEKAGRTLRTEAARQFAICLQACANYSPAIELMQSYDEALYFDFPIPKVEVDTSKKTYKDFN